MKNPITEIVNAQKGAINKSALGADEAVRDYDRRTKNDPNRKKVADERRSRMRKGVNAAETMADLAGINPKIRDRYTKKYK